MPRVDHEAVLRDLAAHIATRTQHGRDQLLPLIAELEKKYEVSESLIERAARIYGVPRLVHAIPAEATPATPDGVRAGMSASGATSDLKEGHDGSTGNGARAA